MAKGMYNLYPPFAEFPLCTQLRIFNLLHALISDLCQSPFERFGFWGRDGLDDTKNPFRVGAIDLLLSSGSIY